MTYPITGPSHVVTANGVVGTGGYWREEDRYAQKAPFDLPLPYSTRISYIGRERTSGIWGPNQRRTSASSFGTRSALSWDSYPSGAVTMCRNRALDRLQREVSESVLGPATLAEGRKTLATMNARVNQGIQLVRAVKSMRASWITDALTDAVGYRPRAESVNRCVDVRRAGGSLGDSMLEVMFGWKPIISDVQAGSGILSSDFGERQISGTSTVRGKSYGSREGPGVGDNLYRWDDYWIKCKVGATVRITNPNLFLANRFGLLNPLATAWELTPWSFVVDYFFNVNQFLSSFTDSIGTTWSRQYTRERRSDFCRYLTVSKHSVTNRWLGEWETLHTLTHCRASTTIPSVKLYRREFSFGKDLSRIVTSSALLLQRLKG